MNLPRVVHHIVQTPIILQGSKYKLIPFLLKNIQFPIDEALYIEPFLGSGIVFLNMKPKTALLSDTNPHIIRFFKDLQEETYDWKEWRFTLTKAKHQLSNFASSGKTLTYNKKTRDVSVAEEYFYQKRREFNTNPNSLDFLFLNRACFNNIMRFNQKGEFNTSFKFDKSRGLMNIKDPEGKYIDLVMEEIQYTTNFLYNKDYTFKCQDFRESLKACSPQNFVYLDPPYFLRDTQYFNSFSKEENNELIQFLNEQECNFAYSNWFQDQTQVNPFIQDLQNVSCHKFAHNYIVGNAQRETQQPVIECLLVSESCQRTQKLGIEKWI